ncbi:TPA: FkbM family methyltransferase [Vibrio cholerae]
MSFISYSQNFEDVMLWRALKHIPNGFYIDVGANDPVTDSITKSFYDRGWSGINIEPLQSHYQELLQARPRDINLNCAAGNGGGLIELWECDVRGWATSSLEVIEQHEKSGYKGNYHKVSIESLSNICAQYVHTDIHFLKIDVEGFEKSVLESMDFNFYRPWILLVEATKPNTTEENHLDWEHLVLGSGYVFAYADGINRFYVADERKEELLPSLKYPPNIFDDYTRSELVNIKNSLLKTKLEFQELNKEVSSLMSQLASSEQLSENYHKRLLEIYASTSWKITKPIRFIKRYFKKINKISIQMGIKWLGRLFILKLIIAVDKMPRMACFLKKIIARVPWLKKIIFNIQRKAFYVPPKLALDGMTPRANQIYQDIQDAIKKRNN